MIVMLYEYWYMKFAWNHLHVAHFIVLYSKWDNISQWLYQVINRSYDDGIKDSPTSLEESHDVLPPHTDDSERGNVSREVR